eukprot:scaffold106740_cov70-Phaeocystis_antarctica.AAC.5
MTSEGAYWWARHVPTITVGVGARPGRLELHVYTALMQIRVEVSGKFSHGRGALEQERAARQQQRIYGTQSRAIMRHVFALAVIVGEGRVQKGIALASQGAPNHQLRRVPAAQPAEEGGRARSAPGAPRLRQSRLAYRCRARARPGQGGHACGPTKSHRPCLGCGFARVRTVTAQSAHGSALCGTKQHRSRRAACRRRRHSSGRRWTCDSCGADARAFYWAVRGPRTPASRFDRPRSAQSSNPTCCCRGWRSGKGFDRQTQSGRAR